MVPACPKYISGKLRSFSKNFSKKFFHTTLFENFLPTDASVANSKNQPSQGLGTPQNRPSAKKSVIPCGSPLFTALRDMNPACPKYISGKLRSFMIFFFIPHFLKIFCYRIQVSQLQKINLPRG